MFSGKVVKGKNIGKKLGFPTANLDTKKNQIDIQNGIYAAKVLLWQREYRGALVIQKGARIAEIHLLDYNGPDFYGAILKVEPLQKISEMTVIKTQKRLKEKIKTDVAKTKKFFRNLTLVHR